LRVEEEHVWPCRLLLGEASLRGSGAHLNDGELWSERRVLDLGSVELALDFLEELTASARVSGGVCEWQVHVGEWRR
jgi:hypothetical protein